MTPDSCINDGNQALENNGATFMLPPFVFKFLGYPWMHGKEGNSSNFLSPPPEFGGAQSVWSGSKYTA